MEFDPERLKLARKLNGFSLQDLENKINKKVTRQSLHKYENGQVIPSAETIDYLANALSVNVGYFRTQQKANLTFSKLRYFSFTKM